MKSPERAAPVKKIARQKPNTVRFSTTGITQVSHRNNVFAVKNGKVDLPADEEWYADMITAGILRME